MSELNAYAHSEKVWSLLNHILNAHHIWNNRITNKEKEFAVWEIHKPYECEEIERKNYKASLKIIDDYKLDQLIDYTNTKGQAFNNSVRDILFHVVNHSTYHRAQIASAYRQNGIEPLVSDYIFYKRM
ncbi:MAG: DinB family protein [Segetibacter sp.]